VLKVFSAAWNRAALSAIWQRWRK